MAVMLMETVFGLQAQEKVVPYSSKPWLPTIWKSEPPAGYPFEKSADIVGVAFTRKYVSYTDADTFYPSWAIDDNMYCGWTDGEIDQESVQSGGRYPCANLVYDGIRYYGTYGVDFDISKPEYRDDSQLKMVYL